MSFEVVCVFVKVSRIFRKAIVLVCVLAEIFCPNKISSDVPNKITNVIKYFDIFYLFNICLALDSTSFLMQTKMKLIAIKEIKNIPLLE